MGSMLHEAVGTQRCFDELNATEPEAVFRVHQAYIEAGAQIIETNTFGANRLKPAAVGLADDVARFNQRGVKIAREARESGSRDVLIAGSIGPLGMGLQSRDLPGDEILDIFKEQAGALEERGVDLFILETFSDLQELLLAIAAVRSFSRLPIVAQLTYSEEGTTHGDVRARDAALRLKEENVQVIGANCTLGPQALLPILQELVSVNDRPVSAMPNAGFPKRQGDRIVYPRSSPEYFALFAREAADLGVRLIGGCCGTTPEHIRALAEAVKSWRPGTSASPSQAAAEVAQETARVVTREPESKLWKKISAGQFVTSVEIDPPTVGDYPETSGVYEIDSVGLVKVLSQLNQGKDWAGKTLGGSTNFTIGAAVNPVAEDLDHEIERFLAKVEAGAHFAMTQPIFDPEHWHVFLKRLGGKSPIPVLVGVWPLNSYKQALRIENEVPGIVIPEPVLLDLQAAGVHARDRGFALARRMLEWARTEVAGVYLIPPFKRYEEILELL